MAKTFNILFALVALLVSCNAQNFTKTEATKQETRKQELSEINKEELEPQIDITNELPLTNSETVPDLQITKKYSFWDMKNFSQDEAIKILMSQMSPEEKLAQLLMVSYPSDNPGELLLSWIRQRSVGSVKIFGRNASSTKILASVIKQIQKTAEDGISDIPPFIATDQEGGWIRHVRGSTSITPGNMAIGASKWPVDAYLNGYYIGLEMKALGISMNFAPTIDLATQAYSTIVGSRAFSDDPTETAILAIAWAKGHKDAGVIPTAKHYPGHGDTELDSHGILPVIDIDKETLWNRELLPYRLLIAEGIPAIMSGHLSFPQIIEKGEAASLSYHLIQEVLRQQLGYDGLVVTDDMMMNGAALEGGINESAEKAIRAGNDILCFSAALSLNGDLWTHLIGLYKKDPSFAARVDESAKRILKAKLEWLLPKGRRGLDPDRNAENLLYTKAAENFFTENAARSATLIGKNDIPIDKTKRILTMGPYTDFFREADSHLGKRTSSKFSTVSTSEQHKAALEEFMAKLPNCDTVILCMANRSDKDFANAALKANKKLYIISVLNPAYAADFIEKATVICVYSFAKESLKAAFAVLTGLIEPIGEFPMSQSFDIKKDNK